MMQPLRPLPVLSALLGLLLIGLVWYLPARPQATTTQWSTARVSSLSYAPYLRGDSPLSETHADAAAIERDLRLLAPITRGVRTYSSGGGFDLVPGIAAKLGLEVMHGAWVNSSDIDSSKQVNDLIRQANEHPKTITRVIVGNEVLLRKDLSPARLVEWIRTVKAAVPQPVTYADVWEFWLKHREVAEAVDFITVHFLPYWENDPVPADAAVAHIRAVYRDLQAAFPGKPIVIGEVGWPSAGRQREGASASRGEQAEFIAAFLKLAAEEGFDYNLIEAFDQPWKRAQEGRTGGNWGLFTAERTAKYAPGEPLSDNPRWLFGLILAICIFLAATFGRRADIVGLTTAGACAAILLGALLAQACAMQLFRFVTDNFYNDTFWNAAPRLALQLALAAALWADTMDRMTGLPRPDFAPSFHAYFAGLRNASLLEHLYRSSVALALVITLQLTVDGRYRDFPHDDFLVIALCFIAARAAIWLALGSRILSDVLAPSPVIAPHGTTWFESRGLALAGLLALALLVIERPTNQEMMIWLGELALILFPHWLVWHRSRRLHPTQ